MEWCYIQEAASATGTIAAGQSFGNVSQDSANNSNRLAVEIESVSSATNVIQEAAKAIWEEAKRKIAEVSNRSSQADNAVKSGR